MAGGPEQIGERSGLPSTRVTQSPRIPDVVRAKIVPAQLPEGLIARPRVLGCLSIDDRFTLVSAMAGFGKTAAVRQWVETVDIPVAWLSLDLLDDEPVSFWSNHPPRPRDGGVGDR